MINTWSKFIYGTTIDQTNGDLTWIEGATNLVTSLASGARTLRELIADAMAAMNLASSNNYVIDYDEDTGLVTLSGDSNFTLPLATGSNIGTSVWPLLGFNQGTDLSGDNEYTGDTRAASEYYPQFLLQSYVGKDDSQQAVDAMVNRAASGRTELIRFGVDKFIEFDIKFITDIKMDGVVIKNNPSGVADAEAFLQDIITKARFEFVPDVSHPSTYIKVICESTPSFKDGTGYKLKELYANNLPGVFETGVIILRVVT